MDAGSPSQVFQGDCALSCPLHGTSSQGDTPNPQVRRYNVVAGGLLTAARACGSIVGLVAAAALLTGCEPMQRDRGVTPRQTEHETAASPQIVAHETPLDAEPNLADVEPAIASYVRRVDSAPADVAPAARSVSPPMANEAPVVDWRPEPLIAGDDATGPLVSDPNEATATDRAAADAANDPVAAAPPPIAPPMVTSIMVNGARPMDVSPQGDARPAGANAPAAALQRPASLEELIKRYYAEPADDSYRAQLDARIMRVLAGDYAGARQPLDLVSQEQQELALRFVDALIAIRDVHMGNLTDGANRALAEIEALSVELADASELTINNFVLCQRVDAFGNYTPIAGEFPTGEPIAFATYCEPRNFVSEQRGDGLTYTELDMVTSVHSRVGETILTLTDENIVDKCGTRRRDFFIAREVHLPPTLSPGQYVVKVTVKDKLGRKVAQARATFVVTIP